MSKGLKIFLSIMGVGFLFFAGIIVAGVFYVKEQLPNAQKVGREIGLEAAAYGKGRYDRDCLKKTMEKSRNCGEYELKCRVKDGFFLMACLPVARKSANFCTRVPKESAGLESGRWRIKKCEEFPDVKLSVCRVTLSRVQQHCHK